MTPDEFVAVLERATEAERETLDGAHWRYISLIGLVHDALPAEVVAADQKAYLHFIKQMDGSPLFSDAAAQDEAMTRKEALSRTGQINPKIIKFRTDLKFNMLKWLDILDTNNISSDIHFQEDFIPLLGNESLSQLGGSTGIRVILAYHAALLECFCNVDRGGMSFIIFDTPKQHEMHGVDLGRYMDALKVFAKAKGIQIIISGTEYRHKIDSKDVEWLPRFPGQKQNMFLKSCFFVGGRKASKKPPFKGVRATFLCLLHLPECIVYLKRSFVVCFYLQR